MIRERKVSGMSLLNYDEKLVIIAQVAHERCNKRFAHHFKLAGKAPVADVINSIHESLSQRGVMGECNISDAAFRVEAQEALTLDLKLQIVEVNCRLWVKRRGVTVEESFQESSLRLATEGWLKCSDSRGPSEFDAAAYKAVDAASKRLSRGRTRDHQYVANESDIATENANGYVASPISQAVGVDRITTRLPIDDQEVFQLLMDELCPEERATVLATTNDSRSVTIQERNNTRQKKARIMKRLKAHAERLAIVLGALFIVQLCTASLIGDRRDNETVKSCGPALSGLDQVLLSSNSRPIHSGHENCNWS